MSDIFKEFLTEIPNNSALREAYKNDKAQSMKDYGVSDEDIQLVMNKDYESIQKKLGNDYEIAKNAIIDAFKIKAKVQLAG